MTDNETPVHFAVTERAVATWAGLELAASAWELVEVDGQLLIYETPLLGDGAGIRVVRHVSYCRDLASGAFWRWTGCAVGRHFFGAGL